MTSKKKQGDLVGAPFLSISHVDAMQLAAVVFKGVREECAQIVDKYAKANAENDIMAAAFAKCADEVRRMK